MTICMQCGVGNPWPMEKSDGMWPSGKRLVWNM